MNRSALKFVEITRTNRIVGMFHGDISCEIFRTNPSRVIPPLYQAEASPIFFDSELAADDSCQLQQEPSARFGEIVIISYVE